MCWSFILFHCHPTFIVIWTLAIRWNIIVLLDESYRHIQITSLLIYLSPFIVQFEIQRGSSSQSLVDIRTQLSCTSLLYNIGYKQTLQQLKTLDKRVSGKVNRHSSTVSIVWLGTYWSCQAVGHYGWQRVCTWSFRW